MILKEETMKSVIPSHGQTTHGGCYPAKPNICVHGTWLPPESSTKCFRSVTVTSLCCKWTQPDVCFLNRHFQ